MWKLLIGALGMVVALWYVAYMISTKIFTGGDKDEDDEEENMFV